MSTYMRVDFVGRASRQWVILEVSVAPVGSCTSLARNARAGLEGATALLREREEEKRSHGVIRKLLSDAGKGTIFTPIFRTSGAMGPSVIALFQSF
jgi:hypothetical protein